MYAELNHKQISDLFFNYEHPNYDELFGDNPPPSSNEIRSALYLDAQSFSDCTGGQIDPDELVSNFISRV